MAANQGSARRTALDVVLYAAARLALLIVLSAAIYGLGRLLGAHDFPVIVAVLLALIIALPMGMWIFSPLRRRATAGLASVGERRRTDRAQLRARLHGEVPPDAE